MAEGGKWATLIALFSALGAFLFGLDIGYIAAILECESFKRDVGHLSNPSDPKVNIDPTTIGFIVAIFSLGCVMASFPPCSAYFLDSLGRRPSITLGSVVFIIGSGAQALATSTGMFMVGRLIAGFSIGLLSTVVACYQSELAPPHMRGALTSLYQLMITFGILVATWLDYALVKQDGGWRIAIAIQVIPALSLMIGTFFMPRSPRWLVQKGRIDEALEVLYTMRSSDGEANNELQEIIDSVKSSEALGEPEWSELTRGRVGGMLAVGVALQLLQQLCGMNAFMYFGPRIFATASIDPLLAQTLVSGVNFLATFPAIFIVDTYGRRCLLCFGAFGMLLACSVMGFIGVGAKQADITGDIDSLGQSRSYIMVFTAFFFVVNFAYSWGPTVWVYTAEMFPLRHRARCMGVTTTANWVGNFCIAQFTPMLLERIGFTTFLLFGMFCAVCLRLALWLPETRGLVLERVGELFDKKFALHNGKSDNASLAQAASNDDGYGAASPMLTT